MRLSHKARNYWGTEDITRITRFHQDITSDKYKLSDVIVGAKSITQYAKTL